MDYGAVTSKLINISDYNNNDMHRILAEQFRHVGMFLQGSQEHGRPVYHQG